MSNGVDMFSPDEDEDPRPSAASTTPRRGHLQLIGGGEVPSMFADRAKLALGRMREVRETLCGGCKADSQLHKTCHHRNLASLDHGFDNDPFCKHAPAEQVKQREKERLQSRYDRLIKAGCQDKHILACVPGSVHSLTPPDSWFSDPFDRERYDAAAYAAQRVARRVHTSTAIVLAGCSGAGKSMCAAGGLATVESGGIWILSTMVEDAERWRRLVSTAHGAEIVVIDDLGRERDGWPVEAMKSLITDLLDSSTPLLITTNLNDDAFAARYLTDPSSTQISGTRLRERLRQRADWLNLGSANLRAHSGASKRSNT